MNMFERNKVHFSDVTNPNMLSVEVEPEWRLGWRTIELRYMADQLVCKDYDPILSLRNITQEM